MDENQRQTLRQGQLYSNLGSDVVSKQQLRDRLPGGVQIKEAHGHKGQHLEEDMPQSIALQEVVSRQLLAPDQKVEGLMCHPSLHTPSFVL